MITNINTDKLAKAFENYVKKFDQIQELAKRFKTDPDDIINMFFSIGLEALSRTENVLRNEFDSKLKELFKDLKSESQKITLDKE